MLSLLCVVDVRGYSVSGCDVSTIASSLHSLIGQSLA